MTAVIFTKRQCPSCVKAKSLLSLRGISYNETIIGEDVLREQFIEMYPDQKTVPLIIMEGQKINGYERLVEYLDSKAQFLAE